MFPQPLQLSLTRGATWTQRTVSRRKTDRLADANRVDQLDLGFSALPTDCLDHLLSQLLMVEARHPAGDKHCRMFSIDAQARNSKIGLLASATAAWGKRHGATPAA